MLYREFLEAGYRIFGLYGTDKHGNCACGHKDCKALLKHPIASNWQYTPVWDSEQIETFEMAGQFATGYGVLCRGLLVIDVDARNGGVNSFERLKNDFPAAAKAGLIVETGSGGGSKHLYFSLPEGLALVTHHADYPGLDFKSSGYVVGPGSLHASGRRYEVAYGSPEDIEPAPPELIALLHRPERHRADLGDGTTMDVSHADIAEMLAVIDPDSDHETWLRCGMAAHHASGGTAFSVWDDWSARGSKYPGREPLAKRWHSFGKSANPVTLGTLVHYAEAAGWRQSVTFDPGDAFAEDMAPPAPTLDISHVNLKRPPGLVGEVTDYVNSQCRRPREHLAVAAALTAIGNVIGLRYTDDIDGVTGNLFTFCVAGSGTGKEAVQQAVAEIHRAARIHPASHGSIKSEQEILRNLTRHQAALYVIDEIGIFLKKIKNAQKSGGAIYLDGVIGCLMSAYSKANGFMLLTGDMKEEVRRALKAELVQYEKQPSPSPAIMQRIETLRSQIASLDNGLERPFLSLIGFTTPETFEETVDFYNATNGFIGRSLLFHERETAPPSKDSFVRAPMDPRLATSLLMLYSAGTFDMVAGGRVENYGPRTVVPTSPDGRSLMDSIRKAFDGMAVDHKATSGLEALALRAYEHVAKVSLILAAPHGLRTAEHILWAYALVKRDIEEKMRLVTANERIKDAPGMALKAKLLNLISGEDGETLGVIRNRTRKHKAPDVEKALDELVKAGLAELIETANPTNGKPVKRYRAA
jgi:hypothetical protein